jgi:hypothetical protein
MKPYYIVGIFVLSIFGLITCLFTITGCASGVNVASLPTNATPQQLAIAKAQDQAAVFAQAQAVTWNIANQYEHANQNGVITQAIASTILTETKSDPKTTQQVLAATALLHLVAAPAIAAQAAGATPQVIQAVQTSQLSNPFVINAAAAASLTPTTAPTTPPTPVPTTLNGWGDGKIVTGALLRSGVPGLRCPLGETRDPYHVLLTRK